MFFLRIGSRRASKHLRYILFFYVVSLISLLTPVKGTGNDLELTVKAAYIYNFLQFIDWPQKGPDTATDPIRICVVGNDSFAHVLEALSNRQAKGRAIEIASLPPGKHAYDGCRVVFIGESAEDALPNIFAGLSGANVLTVSDISQFARKGGDIGFVLRNGKVKIEINLNATRQAGLKVSAKLLEVARIVE